MVATPLNRTRRLVDESSIVILGSSLVGGCVSSFSFFRGVTDTVDAIERGVMKRFLSDSI